ncbi:MAG: S24/S26 family peptidase [Acetatifactor sp.]|nr:S24/S26 family peptidase [Acetatifactor sp.]
MRWGSLETVAVQNLEKLIEEKELVQITPEGYSMYPLMIPGRDQVVIKKTDPERIRRGQVWLYRRPSGMLVLHRVWKVRKDGVYMVGDNQTQVEGPLPREAFIGMVVTFIRKGKGFGSGNVLYVILSRGWLLLRPFRMVIMKPLAAVKRAIKGKQH